MVLLIADLSHPIAELHPADRTYSWNLDVVYGTQEIYWVQFHNFMGLVYINWEGMFSPSPTSLSVLYIRYHKEIIRNAPQICH